jgi:hypothetical protein
MAAPSGEDAKARFEALLAQVLTTAEDAREHAAVKEARGSARQHAGVAKSAFEKNRERPRKGRKPEPKRQD